MKARAFWIPNADGKTRDLVLTFDPKFEEKHPGAEELSRTHEAMDKCMREMPFMRMLNKVKR